MSKKEALDRMFKNKKPYDVIACNYGTYGDGNENDKFSLWFEYQNSRGKKSETVALSLPKELIKELVRYSIKIGVISISDIT